MPSPNPPGHLWRDKWTALSGPLPEREYLPQPRMQVKVESGLAAQKERQEDAISASWWRAVG